MAQSSVSLKLLIDNQAKRVLFAEADKECVDFLFYILSLPVATLIRLLGKNGMVGSLANLYQSIENLNESYIQPNQTKNTLLKPVIYGSSVPLLAIKGAPTTKKFYSCKCSPARNPDYGYSSYEPGCSYCGTYTSKNGLRHVSNDPRAVCPNCSQLMDQLVQYVEYPAEQKVSSSATSDEGGFVKGVVTYMVMDDLIVKPMSTISCIALLNKFNVKDVGALEEKVVNLGMSEAVELLKASLETKNVLTHVFLNGTK